MSTNPKYSAYLRAIEEENQPADFSAVEGGASSTAATPRYQQYLEAIEAEKPRKRAMLETDTPMHGQILRVANQALQGASLNTSDEILAGVRSLPALFPGGKSYGEAYRENVEAERGLLEETRERAPGSALASEIGGAVLTGAGSAALLGRALTPVAQTLGRGKTIALGAGGGASAAAGAATGGPSDRLRAAIPGSVVGAGAAGAFQAAGRVLGGPAKAVGRRILDVTGLRPAADPVARGTVGRVAAGVGVESQGDIAKRRLTEALQSDAVSFEDLVSRAREIPESKPATILDVGGRNVEGVARGAQAIPSRAKEELPAVFRGRVEQAPQRISADIESRLGIARENMVDTLDDLAARQREAARPLYEAAHSRTVQDPKIAEAFKVKRFREAYRRAQDIAEAEGESLPELWVETSNGITVLDQPIPVKALDYMKQGLDDVIDGGMASGGLRGHEARALRTRLNGVLERVDELVPEYGQARQAWAGPEAIKEAVDKAKNEFFKADARMLARDVASMTESEREFFRRQAADEIRQRMEKLPPGRDATRSVFRAGSSDELPPDMVTRIRSVFGDEADSFIKDLQTEARFGRTANVFEGSRTTPLALEAEAVSEVPVEALTSMATGSPMGAVNALTSSAVRNRLRGFSRGIADELSPLLTAGTGPGGRQDMLDTIELLRQFAEEQARVNAARQSGQALRRGAVGTVAGGRQGN